MPKGVQGATESNAELDVEFRYSRVFSDSSTGGKSQIPVIIRGLLDEDIRHFVVAQDLDGGTQEQVVAATADVIYTHLQVSARRDGDPRGLVSLDSGAIWVLPIGLDTDGEFNSLGIAKHSLEDYLIKLMLEDASLRAKIPALKPLLLEILPSIREKDGDFDSSKELFQLIKPLVQHGFSDTGVVERVVKDADESILRSVLAPLLTDVEQAFGFRT